MGYSFKKSPTYGQLKRQFPEYRGVFDGFMSHFLHSLNQANGRVVTYKTRGTLKGKGRDHKITPELTTEFGVDERKIRQLATLMKKFYQRQGLVEEVPKTDTVDDAEYHLFYTTYKKTVSFSDWLLNHADPKYFNKFTEILKEFDIQRKSKKSK